MNRKLTLAVGLSAVAISTMPISALAATKTKVTAGAVEIVGPIVDTRWGPVQVAIDVKAKKIVAVPVPVYPHTKRRSAAIPLEKYERHAHQYGREQGHGVGSCRRRNI